MILKAKRIRSKHINKIKVPFEFEQNMPSAQKLITKTANFFRTGEMSSILVDEKFMLLDGYCSYLIALTLEPELTHKKIKIVMVRDIERQGGKNG